jgi:hypothetical protein
MHITSPWVTAKGGGPKYGPLRYGTSAPITDMVSVCYQQSTCRQVVIEVSRRRPSLHSLTTDDGVNLICGRDGSDPLIAPSKPLSWLFY